MEIEIEHTVGAPSISSMIRQLGRGSAPMTAFIWVADSSLFLKTSTLLSSLREMQEESLDHHWKSTQSFTLSKVW